MADQKSSPDVTLCRGLQNKARWHVDGRATLCTDHLPITINIQCKNEDTVRERLDLKRADWNAWKAAIHPKLTEWERKLEEGQYHDPDDAAAQFSKIIIDTAKDIIQIKRICKHSKPFMTPDLAENQKPLSEAKKKYNRRQDPHNHSHYIEKLEEYAKAYDKAQHDHWRVMCEEISTTSDGQLIWHTVNKILKGTNTSLVQPLRKEDGSYDFDNETISKRLQNVHVVREVKEDMFDKAWKQEVSEEVVKKKHTVE